MFAFLRKSPKVLVVPTADAFWSHCNDTQRIRHTPDGPEANAEERLDLRAGQAIKALLEVEIGPEEGAAPVQMQNWDWNDDRCRGVAVLRRAFKPEVIPKLQALLVGEFADFQVILSLHEDWKSEAWGNMKLSATQVAVQRNVAQAFAIAASVGARPNGFALWPSSASGRNRPQVPYPMPDDFIHRRATTADALPLSTLAAQVFLDTYATHGINEALAREVATVYSAEVFERRLRDAAVELWMVEAGGFTVGFVDIAFATSCPVPGVRGAEVFRLYVQRPFLRRGLGRALMAKAEASARARGLDAIWLTAWAGNQAALAFYLSLGFRDVGATEYVIDGVGYENRVLCKTLAR